MSARSRELAERRASLELRSAAQRAQLAELVNNVDTRLTAVDRGIDSARHFIRQPAVIIGSLVLAAVVGPKRIVRYAGQGLLAVAAVRRLLRLVRF